MHNDNQHKAVGKKWKD